MAHAHDYGRTRKHCNFMVVQQSDHPRVADISALDDPMKVRKVSFCSSSNGSLQSLDWTSGME